LFLLCFLPAGLKAEELEYKMDMGAGLGTCFYLGDGNSTPYANMGFMGGIMARRIFNPRMALKANVAMGHISGTNDGFIPLDPLSGSLEGGVPTKVNFSRNVLDVGVQFELNFWGFGMGSGYKELKRITPYALAGVGLTVGMGGGSSACGALCLPVGVGVKYKLKPRLNVGFEWTMRFTTSDRLDASHDSSVTQLAHPYGIKSVGLKNKDCYNFTMVYLTYEMCPKLRKCNN
jgi:opacity protein-like surface antigen